MEKSGNFYNLFNKGVSFCKLLVKEGFKIKGDSANYNLLANTNIIKIGGSYYEGSTLGEIHNDRILVLYNEKERYNLEGSKDMEKIYSKLKKDFSKLEALAKEFKV